MATEKMNKNQIDQFIDTDYIEGYMCDDVIIWTEICLSVYSMRLSITE